MTEIIAYACSGKPNHLWSAAQFNSALEKNRKDCDIPLVSLAAFDALEAENADLRSGEYLASVVEERDGLRKALLQSTVSNLRSLIDWLDENEENAVLLVASLTEEQIKDARAALGAKP